MICNPKILTPDQTLEDAAGAFIDGVNCAPVMNEHGDVLGILTLVDLVRALLAGHKNDSPVSEVMEKNVPVICEEENFEDVVCDQGVERYVVKDTKGRFTGILSRLELIKRVYESLETTRNELSVVLEAVHNAIVAIDLEERITLYNRAAEKIIGIKAAQAIGRKIDDIIPNSLLPQVLKSRCSQFGQRMVLNNIELVCNRSPIYHQGNLIGAVSVFQDVSELSSVTNELFLTRKLNDELKGIIESSYDGIIVFTPQGEILRANSRSRTILDLPGELTEGTTVEQLPAEQKKCIKDILDKAVGQCQTLSASYKIRDRDVAITANPQLDVNNKVFQVILNIRDMTELNQLKQEVEKTRDETIRYSAELQELRAKQMEINNIIARSGKMKSTITLALRVGQRDSTVLISGESGVGKEVIAKLIQRVSPRARQPFVQINCGAIPENLLESELFGYEPGAFTGARKQGKIGLLETANGGTVFLDEVGELPMNLQVKLLRAIQERTIYRVGGVKPIDLDIRIIAATNRDLEEMVQKNLFREDLYYRLNVIHIRVPPLRERREDIIPLATYFLQRFNNKYGFGWRISPEVYTLLESYNWPGNIRELENVVERAVIMSDGELITKHHLPPQIANFHDNEQVLLGHRSMLPLKEAVQMLEKELVCKALAEFKSTRKAARALGVTHTTVQRKIRQYNLPDQIFEN